MLALLLLVSSLRVRHSLPSVVASGCCLLILHISTETTRASSRNTPAVAAAFRGALQHVQRQRRRSFVATTFTSQENDVEGSFCRPSRRKATLPLQLVTPTCLLAVAGREGGEASTYTSPADNNAKWQLVNMIASAIKSGGEDAPDNDAVDNLVKKLKETGKGFDSDLVDGEWAIVLNRSGKKSPKLQKLVQRTETVRKAFSNFHVGNMTFTNSNFTPRGTGELRATVKYNPVAAGFEEDSDGKIVLRRIMCDIIGASFKYGRLPKLPLPLRSKGGYLDFLYLDEDMRITLGNRGGLFVHFRPEFLDKVTADAA